MTRLLVAFLVVFLIPAGVGAQDIVCDKGDTEVLRLEFKGNHSFKSAVLANGIATTASSWTRRRFKFFGTRYCLDPREFPRDVIRLMLFYRNHGYLSATVDTLVTRLSSSQVAVRFIITEDYPTRVRTLDITGLDDVPTRAAVARALPLRMDSPFDRTLLAASRDTLAMRLRNSGYPDAEVLVNYETDADRRAASVTFVAIPGARARIGAVQVQVRPFREKAVVDTAVVRRLTGLSVGSWYRQRDLERAKRALYSSQLFSAVSIEPDTGGSRVDSIVRVDVRVAEGAMQSARVGGGWGTIDCFRTYADYSHLNVGRRATRVDLRGRVSKIGVGSPLDGFESLCSGEARRDAFGGDLNYVAGMTITPPMSARAAVQPSLTLFSERRSEYNAYLRTTPIGGALSLARSAGRRSQNASYTLEYGDTKSSPAFMCAVLTACDRADQDALLRRQRLAVVGLSFLQERTDNPTSPSRGTVLRGEVRHASSAVGSDSRLQFTRLTLDGAGYLSLGSDIVLAARLRIGAVLGPSLQFTAGNAYVPVQERLYAGGATTVRGFRQNELGPVVYNTSAYDTVQADGTPGGDPSDPSQEVYFRANPAAGGERTIPTGGNTMLVVNLEARVRSPVLADLLQLAFFADAGRVWNRGAATSLNLKSVQWTPGIGVRVRTLVGLIRVDIGYNPYQRAAGSAYFDTPVSAGGQLYCVSPTNTLRVTSVGAGVLGPSVPQQETGTCPASFTPTRERSFFRRLVPQISLGQAF
ncbi:MAG: BamA/TamA family outer membrane protein [Gemmatimonadaceae bacterium]|nr:BamA/TamA family outer membrane protein [Gemmatimonadaceae bacterium]